MWSKHFKDMVDGYIRHRKYIYSPSSNENEVHKPELQLISPSEAVVQRARHDLKRSLKDMRLYNPKKVKINSQLGEGKRKRKITKKKRTIKQKKKSKISKKNRTKKKSTKRRKKRPSLKKKKKKRSSKIKRRSRQ